LPIQIEGKTIKLIRVSPTVGITKFSTGIEVLDVITANRGRKFAFLNSVLTEAVDTVYSDGVA